MHVTGDRLTAPRELSSFIVLCLLTSAVTSLILGAEERPKAWFSPLQFLTMVSARGQPSDVTDRGNINAKILGCKDI